MNHLRCVILGLLLLLAAPAQAAPRVSLITFPPGNTLSSCFGHSVLRVDRDGDLETTGDQRLYDFGVWSINLDRELAKPADMARLFTGLLTTVVSTVSEFGKS